MERGHARLPWQQGAHPEAAQGRAGDLERYALTAFQALGLRDYARIDFRLAKDTVYLIEANLNPYLHSGAEFIRGVRASGRTQRDMITEIVEFARVRYAARPG